MNHLFNQIFAFIYGSLLGSFLNVVIYRLPRQQDMVLQRSACTNCGHKLSWYELVPIFSFIFLRGKCISCKSKISFRYPITEFIVGLMAFYFLPKDIDFSSGSSYLFYFAVFCILLAHFQIDLAHKILPDSLNFILLLLFLSYTIFHYHWTHWFLGGALGFLFPLAITWLFYLLRGQVGLGGGDIKLFGILGIYLGPEQVLKNIFLSCFLGAIVGALLIWKKILKKNEPLAFGPFIIIVAVLQIYFPWILDYFNRFIL
jgi:prepilin signal peptidase PulO-like enzyme (type II secretory pathway)